MAILVLEPTNLCNRRCRHCLRNKADPPESLPLDLAAGILAQARELGFTRVSLTGGEIAVYPHLEELLGLIAEHGFIFDLVTNGHRFRDRLLPCLLRPEIKHLLREVCLSLDGYTPATHDALRGQGSWTEVQEAALGCKRYHIPLSIKTAVTTLNRGELVSLALAGAKLGATSHAFAFTFPTPTLLKDGLMPSPEDMAQAMQQVEGLADAVRGKILAMKFPSGAMGVTNCCVRRECTVDHQGNLVFCCDLSHFTTGDGQPTVWGEELLGDLKKISLKEGIKRHYRLAAKLMEARLDDSANYTWLTDKTCFWCLKYFGKLDWLKDFPDSTWAAAIWPDEKEVFNTAAS